MWRFDWNRQHGYTLLTLFFNDEVRGSVIIRDKNEEIAWKAAIDTLVLNQVQKQE
jgi:hypothetical protein